MNKKIFLFFFYRLVGGFLALNPEFCFIVEDNNEICGYALAALNAKQFQQKLTTAWIPEMCFKYPEKLSDVDESNAGPPRVCKKINYIT